MEKSSQRLSVGLGLGSVWGPVGELPHPRRQPHTPLPEHKAGLVFWPWNCREHHTLCAPGGQPEGKRRVSGSLGEGTCLPGGPSPCL